MPMNVHSKCTYCNFNKYVDPDVDNNRMERALVTELKSELAYWGLDKVKRPIRSVYFGGIQATLLLSSLGLVMDDRIQSFQEHILTDLGRDHSPATALRSMIDARAVWPGRVSMDLIMGHSGQTLEDWIKELRFTMDIVDDHLSLYHLTVEPGTALHKDVKQGRISLPDGDLSTDMYEATIQLTREAGFEHYEVSNFARNEAYSMHNSGHWLGIDYLGIGPGAHGRMTNPQKQQRFRTFNVRDPAGWMRECEDSGTGRRKTDAIESEDSKRELLVLGMRTRRGIDLDRFREVTGQDLLEYLDKDATASCIDAGLLQLSAASLSPTERGMAVADELSVRLLP
ncbi:radical S-adenosyl methionine domain-containing protein 1 [Linnemannia exigua]|uniref:Radical S-adenosyl methionine domain-containing protein 1 n=1 Tax=Linnemannia exigua TaxID=604196 RepID=A0AAD4DIS2_9FUNG|nr:radical S-adenosyl methionine domain-containing protein 1 [Linnemannia exigua]